MAQLRLFARRNKLLAFLYLVVALVGIQSTNLHFHIYDHQHHTEDQLSHDHAHQAASHMCTTACDEKHAHGDATEVSIASEALIVKLLKGTFLLAILIAVVSISFHLNTYHFIPWHRNTFSLPNAEDNLRPPSRAPPLKKPLTHFC